MEPEGSLPHSQVPATCPYPEPAGSSPYPPHPTTWRSVLIFSSHLRQRLLRGLFPSGFLTKPLYTPLLSPIRATWPVHLILDFVARTMLGENYKSLSSSLCIIFHSFVILSLLDRNIFNTHHISKAGIIYLPTQTSHFSVLMWVLNCTPPPFPPVKKRLYINPSCGFQYLFTLRHVNASFVNQWEVDGWNTEVRNVFKNLVGKPDAERPHWRHGPI